MRNQRQYPGADSKQGNRSGGSVTTCPPDEHQPTHAKGERHTETDRCTSQRGGERCATCEQQGSAVGEPVGSPFDRERHGHDGQRQRPQFGLVVDADPAGSEERWRRKNCRDEGDAGPCGIRRGTDRPTRHDCQPISPASKHDQGNEHRDPHEATDEKVAEQDQRHADDGKERPVVQVGRTVDQEALRARHSRVDGDATTKKDTCLLVVEVGAEPGPSEEVPGPTCSGDQPKNDDSNERDRPGLAAGTTFGRNNVPIVFNNRCVHRAGASRTCGAATSDTTNWYANIVGQMRVASRSTLATAKPMGPPIPRTSSGRPA